MIVWIVTIVVLLAAAWYLFLRPASPKAPLTLAPIKPLAPSSKSSLKTNVEKKKVNGPPMKILYGSQTGTAQDFAEILREEAIAHQFDAEVVDVEQYFSDGPERLPAEPGVVAFVVATYGEGEPTDNAKEFVEWLLSDERLAEGERPFESMRYIIFGLGNKTYELYNEAAKKVDRRLLQLGARRIFERGEGDEDSTLEEDYESWRKKLWEPLCGEFGLSVAAEAIQIKPPAYKVRKHEADTKQTSYVTWQKGSIDRSVIDAKNPRECPIVLKKELHGAGSDRSCLHVEIELHEEMRYEAGDHVGVFPENHPELVEHAIRRLVVNPDDIISLIPVGGGRPVIGPCTVRRALARYVELSALPRKTFVQGMLQHTTDEEEKQRIEKLITEAEEFTHWIRTPQRTVLEVLDAFPNCKMPLEHFLELTPAMVPRYYSISSSPKEYPNHVHVTAVLVEYTTGTGRLHHGVCTGWFARSVAGSSRAHVFIRRSNFKLPRAPNTPVLMIGPGTGVAPFRAFIQELKHLSPEKRGKSVLFFGCRTRDHDFLYRDELLAAESGGYLSTLITAFSREQNEKVYVQHRLKEHQEMVWEILNNNGVVYVCGDAKAMAKDVQKTLRQIAIELGGKTPQQAESYITNLQTSNRYLQDVWQ